MTERDTLQCPKCGAPLPPASVREIVTCAFCATASTPAPEASEITAPPAVAEVGLIAGGAFAVLGALAALAGGGRD